MPMITQFDRQEPFITPWWMVWGYISASGIGDPVKNKNYEHRKEMWKFHQFFQLINTIIPTIIFKLILVLKGRKIVKFLKIEKTPLTKIPTVKAAVISETCTRFPLVPIWSTVHWCCGTLQDFISNLITTKYRDSIADTNTDSVIFYWLMQLM